MVMLRSVFSGVCRSSRQSKSFHRFVSSSSIPAVKSAQPVVELREYVLSPEHAASHMQKTADTIDLRKSLAPLRFFSLPDTGGQLNVLTHASYYAGGQAERDEKRAVMASHPDWKAYVAQCRPFVQSQSSLLFVEAPLVTRVDGVHGLAKVPSSQPGKNSILEIRRYKLKLGYDTVPNFLELYGNGLPSKLTAEGTDPTTSLITLLYCEVGRLNEVIEIWRHGNGTEAMERSRSAARGAQEWRRAIEGIASLAIEFTSTIHKPAPFSPLK